MPDAANHEEIVACNVTNYKFGLLYERLRKPYLSEPVADGAKKLFFTRRADTVAVFNGGKFMLIRGTVMPLTTIVAQLLTPGTDQLLFPQRIALP